MTMIDPHGRVQQAPSRGSYEDASMWNQPPMRIHRCRRWWQTALMAIGSLAIAVTAVLAMGYCALAVVPPPATPDVATPAE